MSFDLPQMWHAWPSTRTTYQQPSPAVQQSIPFQMVQFMGCPANTMSMVWWRNGNPIMLPFQLYGLQLSTLPVSQPTAQHRIENYKASGAGPSRGRGQRRGQRKTETPYTNHVKRISSAGIRRDPCTGVTPRRMGAINGTGTGWAGRSPSRVLSSMPDRRCQAMQRNRCDKDRSSFSPGSHRGRFRDGDPSQYEIRIDESDEFDSHQYQVTGGSPALSTTAGLVPVTPPTSTPEVSDMTTGTAAPSITEEQLDEEEQDFDGISLGSEPSEYQY